MGFWNAAQTRAYRQDRHWWAVHASVGREGMIAARVYAFDPKENDFPESLSFVAVDHALEAHGRQVLTLHLWHSKMNQCGPEWQ